MRTFSSRAPLEWIRHTRAASPGGYDTESRVTFSGCERSARRMESGSICTPLHEKSTRFIPSWRVSTRSSSTRVAAGLSKRIVTASRSGRAASLVLAWAVAHNVRSTAIDIGKIDFFIKHLRARLK
jgi:hypothetical protein